MYVFSMVLVIITNLMYHLVQKTIPGDKNPFTTIIFAYITAIISTLVLIAVFQRGESPVTIESWRLHWSSVLLGLVIVGAELGFLLIYRAGWVISTSSIFANVVVTIALVPIGLLFFKEELSVKNVAGIAICLVGLYFMKN